MNDNISEPQAVANEVVALRYFVTEFATLMLTTLGQTKEEFDVVAARIREGFGVTDRGDPRALRATSAIPDVLARLDKLMSDIRQHLPS